MTEYQVSQLQLATLVAVVAVMPLGFVAVFRRRTVAPVVTFGVLVGVLDALGFALGYLGSEGTLTPRLQVLINYLKDAPASIVVVYTCLMQVRRYKTARSGDRLRGWFKRSPYVIGLAFLCGLVLELVIVPPVLESEKRLPALAFFFESARYVSLAFYAALASFVFFGAAVDKSGSLTLNQRLQNLFGGIALAGLSALPLHTLAWRATRVFFLPEERITPLLERFSAQETVLVGVIAGSVSAGLLCYYRQNLGSEFTNRFLSFLGLVSDLTEAMANVAIFRGKLNLPYAYMHEASGEEFLGFSSRDKRRMDTAFRMRVILEHRTEGGNSGKERIHRGRLAHLAKLYDDEFGNPVLIEGLKRATCWEDLPDTLKDLLPLGSREEDADTLPAGLREALALVLSMEDADGRLSELTPYAEWEQLVCLACADAGLLPRRHKEAVLCGQGISEGVLTAYGLAQYKLHNYADGYDPSTKSSEETWDED